jgi:hypothetical protein
MPPLMRLPTYEVPRNALIDFAPINQAFAGIRQQENQDRQFGLQQQGMDLQKQQFGLTQEKAARERENEIKRRMGNAAVLALLEADQGKRASMHQSLLGLHPDAKSLPDTYRDPSTGLLSIVGDAGMAGEYLQAKLRREETARAAAAQANQQRMEQERLRLAQGADTRAAETHQAQLQQFKLASPDARAQAAAQYGLQPGTPQYQQFVLQGTLPAKTGPDATDKKALWEAEDNLPDLKTTIDQLQEAAGLVPNSYHGYLSQTRSGYNQSVSGMLPNVLSDPKTAANTVRLNQLMSEQAISAMSSALKGATTDKEMEAFRNMMADPNSTADQKLKAINGLLLRAQRKYQVGAQRIQSLGGTIPSLSAPTPPPSGGVQRVGTPPPAASDPSKLSDDDLKKALGLP